MKIRLGVFLYLLCVVLTHCSGFSVAYPLRGSPYLGPRRPEDFSLSHPVPNSPPFSASGALQSANLNKSVALPPVKHRHQHRRRARGPPHNQSMLTNQRRLTQRETYIGSAYVNNSDDRLRIHDEGQLYRSSTHAPLNSIVVPKTSARRRFRKRVRFVEPFNLPLVRGARKDEVDMYRDDKWEDGPRNPRSANGTNRFHRVFHKKIVLMSASATRVIAILPDGGVKTLQMEGTAPHNVHPRALLNIRTVSSSSPRTVVQSTSLGLYLCIDSGGRLYATCNFNRECEFLYNFEDTNYNTLQSYIYRRLYISVSQQGNIRRSKPHQGPLGMDQSFLPISIPETKAREVLTAFYRENPSELQHCADYRGFVPSNAVQPHTISPTPRPRGRKRNRVNGVTNSTHRPRHRNPGGRRRGDGDYDLRGRNQPTGPQSNRPRESNASTDGSIATAFPPRRESSVLSSVSTVRPSETSSTSRSRKKKKCRTRECRRKRRRKRKEKLRKAYRRCMSLDPERRPACMKKMRRKLSRRTQSRENRTRRIKTSTDAPNTTVENGISTLTTTTVAPSLATPHSSMKNEIVSYHQSNDVFPPNSYGMSFSDRSQGLSTVSRNNQWPFQRTPSWSPAQPRTASIGERRIQTPRRRPNGPGPKAQQYENKSERYRRLRGRNLRHNQIR